jgi:N-acetylmuramoyl-L-alanine amidase
VPSVLIELGFMSNPLELNLLQNKNYQALMARGLYDAVLELAAVFERS